MGADTGFGPEPLPSTKVVDPRYYPASERTQPVDSWPYQIPGKRTKTEDAIWSDGYEAAIAHIRFVSDHSHDAQIFWASLLWFCVGLAAMGLVWAVT